MQSHAVEEGHAHQANLPSETAADAAPFASAAACVAVLAAAAATVAPAQTSGRETLVDQLAAVAAAAADACRVWGLSHAAVTYWVVRRCWCQARLLL